MSTIQTALPQAVAKAGLTLVPTSKQVPAPKQATPLVADNVMKVIDAAQKITKEVATKSKASLFIGGILLEAKEEDAISWVQTKATAHFEIVVLGVADGKGGFWEIRSEHSPVQMHMLLGRLRKRECGIRSIKIPPEQFRQITAFTKMELEGASSWIYDFDRKVIMSSLIRKERTKLNFEQILDAVHYALSQHP